MTEKLYDISSKIKEFDATVVSSEPHGDVFYIELDRTAFFPESGGQCGDSGMISDVPVLDTQFDGDRIVHITKAPLAVGQTVKCSLEWESRFRRMQNHTGEHIVSSIMHRKYGFSNVGFHLSKDEMTFDFDGVISEDEMQKVELEANIIALSNVPVKTYYPDENTLAALDYRSKGGLSGAVRIVEIEGVDMCACCAPHVERTGEIGIIKILGFIHYKGGIRVRMQCGLDALDDYRGRISRETEISNLLCVPQEESALGVKELLRQLSDNKSTISKLKKTLAAKYAESVMPSDKNVCFKADGLDAENLRELANLCTEKCNIFAACSGSDDAGYLFICASRKVPLRPLSKIISEKARGKCGGSDLMLTGKLGAKFDEIKQIIEEKIL